MASASGTRPAEVQVSRIASIFGSHNSLTRALHRIDHVLAKARFWQAHREQALSAEQAKVLNRLLDGGESGEVSATSSATTASTTATT